MSLGTKRKIELVANLATIAVACVFGALLVTQYLWPSGATDAGPETRTSKDIRETPTLTMSSLDVDWKKNKRTLLLAISSTCQFCTDSAPFYQTLYKSKGDTHLVAVLPQPIEEAKKYLAALGVKVDETRHLALETIGISGTPTVMLVDGSGTVTKLWLGKLSPDQETQVLNALMTSP